MDQSSRDADQAHAKYAQDLQCVTLMRGSILPVTIRPTPPPPSGGYIPPQTPRCGSVRKWRSGGREFESRSGWRVFFLFPFRKLSTLKKLQTIKSYGKFNGHGKKARQEGFHTANTGEM